MWLLGLASLLGCGGGGRRPDRDAGVGVPDASIFEPTPPEPAAVPVLTPCPDGWRAVEDSDVVEVVTCDPWPEAGVGPCADDEAPFVGTGCARIGTACPAGEFADDLPAGATVRYVRAGGAPGGDGSLTSPWGSLAEGVASAPEGAILALSKGTFEESGVIVRSLTLWGACVAETVVHSSNLDALNAVLAITGAGGVTLRDLQISGDRIGLKVHDTRDMVTIESVLISSAYSLGVQIWSADVTAHELVVRDTRSEVGTGYYGDGLDLSGAAHVTLDRVVVERNVEIGINVWEAGTTLEADDLLVSDTQPGASGEYGTGVSVTQGARAVLARAVVERNRFVGVGVSDAGSTLEAADLVVRATATRLSDGTGGIGVIARGGSTATLARASIAANHDVSLEVYEAGTDLHATDVVVRDSSPQDDGAFGQGIEVALGAAATLARIAVLRATAAGIVVAGTGSSLDASDLRVAVTQPDPAGAHGYGIDAIQGGHIGVTRARIEENVGAGILVGDPYSTFEGADLDVRDTSSFPVSGEAGLGLAVQDGALATVTRAAISSSRRDGVFVAAADASMEDVRVAGVLEQACASSGCPGQGGGRGIVVLSGGGFDLSRFQIADAVLCGLQLATGGVADLHHGVVARSPIGANVQTADFETGRLLDDVAWIDVGQPLDGSALPVPDSLASF